MYRLLKTLTAVALLLILSACQNKSDEGAKANGGVDGSGGNLAQWTLASMTDWVQSEHRFFVRDMFHRLYLIKENSPQDFNALSPYMSRLLSGTEAEMNALLDKLQYFVVDGACPNSLRADKDASVTPDGKVCLSYAGFKKVPLNELVPQILLLTLHEVSHLKGFDEKDAVTLQATVMQTVLRDMSILFFNNDYKQLNETFSRIQFLVSLAFQTRYSSESDSGDSECSILDRAIERMTDFYGPWQKIPTFIQARIEKEITQPLNLLTCDLQKSKFERANILAQIMKSLVEIKPILENYESPICIDNLCSQRRPSLAVYSPEFLLQIWNIEKKTSVLPSKLKPLDPTKIHCMIQNIETKDKIILDGPDKSKLWTSADLQKLDKSLQSLSIAPALGSEKNGYWAVTINVNHMGSMHLIQGEDFYAGFGEIAGHFISGGLQNEIKASLEVLEEQNSIIQSNDSGSHSDAYYMFDPWGNSIHNKPNALKHFELTCNYQE